MMREIKERSTESQVDARKITSQVERIAESSYFKSAKQMKRFLIYVVSQSLEGGGGRIKQYSIAVEALNLTADFDPDLNPYVRIMGGRVRSRLLDYYKRKKADDLIMISLPKGSYRPSITTINTNKIHKKNRRDEKNKDLSYYILMS